MAPEKQRLSQQLGAEVIRKLCHRAFDSFDTDHNGFIDLVEFRRMVQFPDLQSPQQAKLSDQDVARAVQAIASFNHISFEDFYQWISNPNELKIPELSREAELQLTHIRAQLQDQSFEENLTTFGLRPTFYCQVCFEHVLDDGREVEVLKLRNCGHKFCRECIAGFFGSQVINANVYLQCFADTRVTSSPADAPTTCHTDIAHEDILLALRDKIDLTDKYLRFKERKVRGN